MPQGYLSNDPNWGAPASNGTRADGSQKGDGFLGVLQRPDGKVSSEISIGVNIDGKEVQIPTLVPTLTQQERDWLLKNDVSDPKQIPRSIVQKAVDYARPRIKAGKSPFASADESRSTTALESLAAMQSPIAMRAHGETPTRTTNRMTAGPPTNPLPSEPSLMDKMRDSRIVPPGFTPNEVQTYATEGPLKALRGLYDLSQGNYAKGGHETLSGAGVSAIPFGVGAAMDAPFAALSAYIFGSGGKFVAERAADAMGATPDQRALAGDVGGIVGGGMGATVPSAARGVVSMGRSGVRVLPKVASAVINPSPANALRVIQELAKMGRSEAPAAAESTAVPSVARPPAPVETPSVTPPTPPATARSRVATPGARPARPSTPRRAASTPSASTTPTTGDSFADLNITPEELAQGERWVKSGVPADKILERILAARELTQRTGTTTPDQMRSHVNQRNETGRWPGEP